VRNASGETVIAAIVPRGQLHYAAPSWFGEKAGPGRLMWRVVALSADGEDLGGSGWRDLHALPGK
jgi:hypothetical protein